MAIPAIIISPAAALTDEPVNIRVSGFTPGQQITVRARTNGDDLGRLWQSHAVFPVSENGTVDLATQPPLAGTYQEADPMGLFWTMELDPAATDECYFYKRSLDPIHITFTAEVDGYPMARATAERRFLAPGVTRHPLREHGLVGTYFDPHPAEPHPAIIVLGGGDGGVLEHGAALLASHGYPALALGYFNAESLPPDLVEIPLEYFDRAIRWLQTQPGVDPEAIAISGTSLGGMFALLVGATFPAIKAVISYVGVGLIFSTFNDRSPCTHLGQPLPSLVLVPTADDLRYFEEAAQTHTPSSGIAMIRRALADETLVAPADIPVERINGPVLLLTGADDQMIPSPAFADRVITRLDKHHFPHFHEHVSYPGAGHAMGLPHTQGLPYMPTYGRPPATGPIFDFGGTPPANARANIASWQRLLHFLSQTFP